MMRKVLLMLCSSALVSAGIIGTDYSPATSVSYSSIPSPIKTISSHVIEKSIAPIEYTKIIQSAPVYQSILTTKESNFESPDGTQHVTYSKSLDTDYSSLKKFETKSNKDGDVVANTIPGIYSPVVYHPSYSLSSPVVHTVSSPTFTKSISIPVSYTTHDVPLTKTIVTPSIASYSAPVFDKTKILSSGLSSYSSHTPILEAQPVKTTITYSEAPLVSHMTFTGLGANYAW